MSANGISTLATKQLKQEGKLAIAELKRQGTTQAGSLVFSGSAQLDMSAAANTNLGDSTAFTIEVWVYVTAYIPAANGILIQQGGQKNVNYATHQLSLSNNTIIFNTGTGSGGANTGGKTVNSSTPLPLSTWTHIAVVWDGTNIKLYQGGVLVGTTAANPLQMGTNSANLTIGNISGGGANDYFTGRLYGIRIVKNVAVYTGAFTVPTSPLTPTQSSGTNITAITGTATGLLLNAATSATYLTDSSSYAATVSNSSVTWSASGPSLTNTSANFYRTLNVLDINLLPTKYVDDTIYDNPNLGALTLTPGVIRTGVSKVTYTGYHEDNVAFTNTATATASTTANNFTIASIAETTTVLYTGYLLATYTGTWTFVISSDDGSYLWIGNTAVSGYTTSNELASASYAGPGTGTISLTAGEYYPIRLLYGNGPATGSLNLTYAHTGQTATSDFTGKLFSPGVVLVTGRPWTE